MASVATPPSSSQITTDGPVLNLINKRLRTFRKKLNRISQMEESRSQGKILNKEQEETLRSKSSVISALDELEKLRQPLSQAVDLEIQLAFEKNNMKRANLATKSSIENEIAVPDSNDESAISDLPVPDANDESMVSDLLGLMYFGAVF